MIGSIVLLARNENNFVEQKAALKEGESLVQDANAQQLNPELDGKLVHIQGVTSSPASSLQDPRFGVKADDLKLISDQNLQAKNVMTTMVEVRTVLQPTTTRKSGQIQPLIQVDSMRLRDTKIQRPENMKARLEKRNQSSWESLL